MSPTRSPSVHRVLMVDDERALLDGFRIAFKRAGRPVATSETFEDARKRLLEEKFDVTGEDFPHPTDDGVRQTAINLRFINSDVSAPFLLANHSSDLSDSLALFLGGCRRDLILM